MSSKSTSTTIYKECKHRYKDICNALDCYNKSDTKLNIECGPCKILTIFVCKTCIDKFYQHTAAVNYSNYINNEENPELHSKKILSAAFGGTV